MTKLVRLSLGLALGALISAASAQTNVTNSNNGSTNTVPVYTGTATLGNSPISVSGGNVGIGTPSPAAPLHVVGTIRKDFTATASGGTAYWMLYSNDGNGNFNEYINSTGTTSPTAVVQGAGFRRLFSPEPTGTTNAFYYQYANTVAAGASQSWLDYIMVDATNNNLGLMDQGGKVGIGTSTPSSTLDVNGGLALGPSRNPSPPNTGGVAMYFRDIATADWALDTSNFQFTFINSAGNPLMVLGNTGSPYAGRVGIGMTNPLYTLDVAGQIRSSSGGIVFPDGSVQATAFNPVGASSGSTISEVGGNVGIGIGTANSSQLLQVGSTYAQNPSIMIGGHDNNNSSVGSYALLFGAWRDVESTITSGIVATPTWTCCGGYPASGYAGIRENNLGFYTIYDPASPSTYSPNMLINTSGNVGIGTTSPTSLLSVGSSSQFAVNASGGVTAASLTFSGATGTQTTPWTGVLCGGDYAEAVDPAGDKQSYAPGDVLVITDDEGGDVRKSSEPYSTMVAGIYATKPGVVGRREGLPQDAQDLPMAMVGIVPAKVTAENGSIHRGDLLVTSSLRGYAMKGTDRNRLVGAVIGKAMGTLNSGSGMIEVLVTLQ